MTVGVGAWCGQISLHCLLGALNVAPGSLLLFGAPAALVETAVVMILAYVVKVRLGAAVIAALVGSQAVLGFVVGATALAGQGPSRTMGTKSITDGATSAKPPS